MNSNRVKEIKKEDKKAFKSFIIIMIISGIVGGLIGGMSVYFKDNLSENLPDFIISILGAITPFASLVLSLLVIITSSIVYKKLTKELKIWNESDEEDMIDKIEEKLSYILLLSSVNLIMGFFFFGVGFALPSDYLDLNVDIVKRILFFVGFVLCVASSILIQKKFVNLEKEINPMLKGSVYDVKFSEKWIDSCDEAIKMNIYKSSYKAYKAVTNTCLILWFVCILGLNVWDFGLMPLFIVTIIWLVQTVAYCLESIKSSKKR